MSKTKTMLATLALGATVAFAGPAFAEKMKATLDGKSEVPAEHQRRQRHRRYRLRCRHQEAELEADLFRAHRPGDRGAFPRAGRSRQERRRRGCDSECHLKPGRRQRHADGRPGRRSGGRQVLRQRPHRGQSGRRNPRSGDEVSLAWRDSRTNEGADAPSSRSKGGSPRGAPFLVRILSNARLSCSSDPKGLVATGALACRSRRNAAFSVATSLIWALASVDDLAEARDVLGRSRPCLPRSSDDAP